MRNTMKKETSSVKKLIFSVLPAVLAGILFLFFFYFSVYHKADESCERYLKSDGAVKVSEMENGFFFDGEGKKDLFIFYPGAKVEESAYAPLMRKIAEKGTDCYLVRMPLRFSLFAAGRAEDALDELKDSGHDHENIIIGGHSLGGTAASMYIDKNPDEIKGIVFIASYPAEEIKGSVRVLSIKAGNDGVLDENSYEESFRNRPRDFTEKTVKGGNHAGFGCYGEQKRDGKAEISPEIQQDITSDIIINWL